MNLEKCRNFFADHPALRLLVGFSGGADSTAALLTARACSGAEVIAIHFNHGLRGAESDAEAAAAAEFARQRGIPFRCIRLALDGSAPNLEARAREARLREWKRLAGEFAPCAVVLGHHADDRLENFLLRLGRGSNCSGLTSLRGDAVVDGVRFLRPLLGVTRKEIEEFLYANGITGFARDSSNADETIRRNALRRRILPDLIATLPGGRRALEHSLEACETDALFLEECARSRFAGGDWSRRAAWRQLPPALLVRVLRLYLARELGHDFIAPHTLVDRLRDELDSKAAEPHLLPLEPGCFLRLDPERVAVVPAAAAAIAPLLWDWRSEPVVRWGAWRFSCERAAEHPVTGADRFSALFDAARLPGLLCITTPEAGARMIPFGRTEPVRLKKLRTDRKIPGSAPLAVIRASGVAGEICWFPGIRHSAYAPVTNGTREIVLFRAVLSCPTPYFPADLR